MGNTHLNKWMNQTTPEIKLILEMNIPQGGFFFFLARCKILRFTANQYGIFFLH